MAIKKSELYSSLWASCDELRGGMDASQYKDYVLVMLFVKYISDKYAGQPYATISVPKGASFANMVNLKGDPEIGDKINKHILAPLKDASGLTEMPDFNDVSKLGDGQEMVDRLSNLIAIFEKPELDFSGNRAEGDDILGDAYEYLMRHFATESGKSKGQFYTPAEVSRTMAQIIGIRKAKTSAATTIYDPTCGSGSLLLRVGAEADTKVTLYGQEKEATTAGLALMNMILHDYPTAVIKQGNTLSKPLFEEDGELKQFDFVVANPPFSDKRWGTGLNLPEDGRYNRFAAFGVPPAKNGDFAYLLHIVRSLKRHGKGAVILPHGVLFRGNAEAAIRENLIKKGYIKGIIGLPPNLFYGTGIPACIILIDKENAQNRKGIFMLDAGKGFMKDGPKNRLREQDIRMITDHFNQQKESPGYSRMVSIAEIETNEYNLNLPRYIDSQEQEDVQDIEAHLLGGIPNADIAALNNYWAVFPTLQKTLFAQLRKNYSKLKIAAEQTNQGIYEHPEFVKFSAEMDALFTTWQKESSKKLKALGKGLKPKPLIKELAEKLLASYAQKPLVNPYNIYQQLMNYWYDTMQDDTYIIAYEGWKAETARILVLNKQKKAIDKGWYCDLVPKELLVARYFATEQQAIDALSAQADELATNISELEEEHGGEEGHFAELDKINKGEAQKRIKAITEEKDKEAADELKTLKKYVALHNKLSATRKDVKTAEQNLDEEAYNKYPTLSEQDVKTLVVDDKWMANLSTAINDEIEQTSQHLSTRIKELAQRYAQPLPEIDTAVNQLEEKVISHLAKMGYAC